MNAKPSKKTGLDLSWLTEIDDSALESGGVVTKPSKELTAESLKQTVSAWVKEQVEYLTNKKEKPNRGSFGFRELPSGKFQWCLRYGTGFIELPDDDGKLIQWGGGDNGMTRANVVKVFQGWSQRIESGAVDSLFESLLPKVKEMLSKRGDARKATAVLRNKWRESIGDARYNAMTRDKRKEAFEAWKAENA